MGYELVSEKFISTSCVFLVCEVDRDKREHSALAGLLACSTEACSPSPFNRTGYCHSWLGKDTEGFRDSNATWHGSAGHIYTFLKVRITLDFIWVGTICLRAGLKLPWYISQPAAEALILSKAWAQRSKKQDWNQSSIAQVLIQSTLNVLTQLWHV